MKPMLERCRPRQDLRPARIVIGRLKFKAVICDHCGEVQDNGSWLASMILLLLSPFWWGDVEVLEGSGER